MAHGAAITGALVRERQGKRVAKIEGSSGNQFWRLKGEEEGRRKWIDDGFELRAGSKSSCRLLRLVSIQPLVLMLLCQ